MKCSRCHRRLTDPYSMKIGMGPECRSVLIKRGWRFPKPVYRVQHGHVVLEKLVGKIAPPAPKSRRQKAETKVNHEIKTT